MVHVTDGLLTALLDRASADDPESVTMTLSSTPAGELTPRPALDGETLVLSHLYLPSAGESVSAVFGMDLGVPAGSGRARFVSHPDGRLTVTQTDDLAGVVVVAVPPYERDHIAAFDRGGSELDLTVVEAAPPPESHPE